ncbi:hypothetical protein BDD12DRAFT_118373 [Trichophaea hybrida]|nr:hypothetical protein BDD12DRAFT_118373 [Trichophaea hybrida]
MQSWAAAMKTSTAVDGDVVGATLSEPPVFPDNVPQDESDEVSESESDDSGDEVIYVGTKVKGNAGDDDGGDLSGYDSCPKPLHSSSSSSSLDEGEVRDVPESNDAPESKVHSEVDLDRLLISIQDSSKPGPLLLAPPAPSVLGKRARSPSPELALSPELFEEIGRVNGMFRVPCINLEAPPATFELCVAGSSEWRVLLAFSSDYPSELPSVIQLDGHKHGAKMFKLTKDILRGDNFQGGTPCLEKLMRELVEALAGKLGTIPWKFIPQTTKFVPKPSSVGGFMTTSAPKVYPKAWFPSFEEFDDQMRALRAASVDYPPKLPVYAKRGGWNTAFISEPYARSLLKEGKVIEGNERLEACMSLSVLLMHLLIAR